MYKPIIYSYIKPKKIIPPIIWVEDTRHIIHTEVTFLLTSDIKCMTCGFIRWPYRILYTWYIYTPVTRVHKSDITCMTCGFLSCLDKILCTWYIYTQVTCLLTSSTWPVVLSDDQTGYFTHDIYKSVTCLITSDIQVYELWFYLVTLHDTLHMIYIHQ